MDDYISRQVILKHLEKCKGQPPEMCYSFAVISEIERFVKNQLAADVAPVIHARWKDRLDGITPFCTACGCAHNCLIRHPPYCPHCGAIMDLKDKQT